MTNIFKEIEAQEYSVQDIRFGMAALLQCNTSDIDELDNRKYDEYFQAVTRVLYAVKLSVQKDKLFGNEIYQAAANHFEQKIKELEQQLEVARKVPDGYTLVPIEPTDNMKKSYTDKYGFPSYGAGHEYKFMVLAAIRQIGGAE